MSKKAVKFIGGIVLVSIAGVAGYGFMHKDQLMDRFSSPAVSEEAAPATEPVEVMEISVR